MATDVESSVLLYFYFTFVALLRALGSKKRIRLLNDSRYRSFEYRKRLHCHGTGDCCV